MVFIMMMCLVECVTGRLGARAAQGDRLVRPARRRVTHSALTDLRTRRVGNKAFGTIRIVGYVKNNGNLS